MSLFLNDFLQGPLLEVFLIRIPLLERGSEALPNPIIDRKNMIKKKENPDYTQADFEHLAARKRTAEGTARDVV
jgi:hypothetical protein